MKFCGKVDKMRNNIFYILISIAPLLLAAGSYIMKEAGGPYYLNYYDPGYVYLANSLNVKHFAGVGHTDHPGTTVQEFGALVLMLAVSGDNEKEIAKVFYNPEKFLELLNRLMVLMNCAALWLLGWFAWKKSGSIYFCLLLQLSLFISFEIWYGLVIFSPENFLLLSALILSALTISYTFDDASESKLLLYSIMFGIICGFGTVSKLNFAPLCVLPLILLPGLKYKIVCLTTTLVSFAIFFLPAFSNFGRFTEWFSNLVLNAGVHGRLNISNFTLLHYLKNLGNIFSKDLVMTVMLMIMISALILYQAIKKNNVKDRFDRTATKETKALFAITLTILLQIIATGKNYIPNAQYYIIPSLALAVTGLGFALRCLLRSMGKMSPEKPVFSIAIILVFIFAFYEFTTSYIEASEFRDEAVKINAMAKELSLAEYMIPTIAAANEDCGKALCIMYGYAGEREELFREVLSASTISRVYHNYWDDTLFTISNTINIKEELSSKKELIIQITSPTSVEKFVNTLKVDYGIDVISNELIMTNGNGESLYRLFLKQ